MKRPWMMALLATALALVGMAAWASDDAGPEVCAECHDDVAAAFAGNPHSALDTAGLAAAGEWSCTSCHGDPTEHLEEGGEIFNFGDDVAAPARWERCLSCHGDQYPRYQASPHARAGLDCTECHAMHGETGNSQLKEAEAIHTELAANRTSNGCAECHGDVFAQFQFNERHRLQEGILECTSCHNPHEPATRLYLGGFKQEACLTCHADKGGPFVYEHGSLKVEGCVSCHSPHGSPNRHLLTFQNQADMCYSCHNLVPGFHTRFVSGSQCTNCHSTIHGSNFHPAFLQ